MPIDAVCPGCKKQYRLKEEMIGKSARCKGCQETFVVKPMQPEQGSEKDDEEPKRRPAVKAAGKGRSISEEGEDKNQRPAKGKRARPDAEDERPSRKKLEKRGAPVGMLIGLVVGCVLVLGGLGVGGYFLFRSTPIATAPRGPVAQMPGAPGAQGESKKDQGGGKKDQGGGKKEGPVSVGDLPPRDAAAEARRLADHTRRTQEAAKGELPLIQQIRLTEASKNAKANYRNQALAVFEVSRGNNQMVLSPDGNTIAVASEDKTVKLCDLRTCTIKHSLKGHTEQVVSVAFSPDGATLVSASSDRLRFWDTKTGGQKSELTDRGAQKLYRIAFSPDGLLLAGAGSGGAWGREYSSLRVRAAQTGELVGRFNVLNDPLSLLTFSPDGRILVTAGEREGLRLWDVATGNRINKSLEAGLTVRAFTFSPDGQTLAVVAHGSQSRDEFLRLYNVYAGGKQSLREGMSGVGSGFGDIAFSPDGTLLAASVSEPNNWRGITIWDLKTNKERARIETDRLHSSLVKSLAFSPGGTLLIAAGYGSVSVHVVADVLAEKPPTTP